jgi:hypothetical protein
MSHKFKVGDSVKYSTAQAALCGLGARARRDPISMQAGAALAPGVSQQTFKHVTGIRVAGVVAAHVTPISEIPFDGAGSGD